MTLPEESSGGTMIDKGQNRTVLFVDDEESILESYRMILEAKRADNFEELLAVRERRHKPEDVSENRSVRADFSDYNILLASSGEEAVEIVRRQTEAGERVAAGFFDMHMPGGIDGLETIRRIKAIDPDMLCAVVTAFTDRSIDQIGAVFKSQDEWIYFNKPFSKGELIQTVISLVSSWNSRRREEKHIADLEVTKRCLVLLLEGIAGITKIPPLALDSLLKALLELLADLVGHRDLFILLLGESGEFLYQVGSGKFEAGVESDPELLKRIEKEIESLRQTKSMKKDDSGAVVPFMVGNKIIGLVFIPGRENHMPNYQILELFGIHAVNLIQSSNLYQALEQSYAELSSKNVELMQVITKLTLTEKEKEEYQEQSVTDELTGLYNRRFIERYFEMTLKKTHYPFACVMIDIDDFKRVNDTHGHLAGDYVLKELAHIISENKRPADIASRYGGEEFVLVLENINQADLPKVVERLRHQVAGRVFSFQGHEIRVTISIGVSSSLPLGCESCDSMIEQADQALYKAKEAGRNTVVMV
ncbi:MAG: diguanylate cyclase [Candidatus Zixiibacteriota bacterium]|nr:MAG: diguanylate cyclase [candidate division Zixibacteria bacterium]